MEDNSIPQYLYHCKTRGGFYNDKYKRIHHLQGGDYLFKTKEERKEFINHRKNIEKELNAKDLVFSETEGYCCTTRTAIHRVIEYKGKKYYSKLDMGINYPFSAANYHLNNKWYPGFNDYPLGEDFDYSNGKYKVVAEWISGADQVLEDMTWK